MVLEINNKKHNFSFIESLTSEQRDPFQSWHFEQTMQDIRELEGWMKEHNIENGWSLTEKLAFLRNVESTIRTGSAVRRTQLTWFAVAIGTIGAILGFIIGINA